MIAPAGYGTAIAVDLAKAADRSGADGILLLPHYLSEAGPQGLEDHVRAVCRATELGVIIYNRANARYDADTVERLATDCPNLIGFKDGVGDIEQMTRIYSRLGDRLLYVGGLPTAEMYALPYLSLGLTTYSSAIFNFLPQWALDFYAALAAERHGARVPGPERLRDPVLRSAQPHPGLRGQHHQGRHEGDRPTRPARSGRR